MSYTYATLSAAIANWADRSYTTAQTDEFIMLAEAAFNRRLKGYEREVTGTIALTDGVGNLPAGFIRFVSVSFSTYGTLRQVAPDSLVVMNPAAQGGIAREYAVTASNIKTAFNATDTLNAIWMASLAPLSSDTATNWLLDLAPDAYLWMTRAQSHAFHEEWQIAAGAEAKANGILDELNLQSDVAQYGRATLVLNGPTP